VDEVVGVFVSAALKTNTSVIDGDLCGEQRGGAAVSCGWRRGDLPRWVVVAPDRPDRWPGVGLRSTDEWAPRDSKIPD
jgi:hypothetical protein